MNRMEKVIRQWIFSKIYRSMKSRKISNSEIICWEDVNKITKGLSKEIGSGGSSTVYLGRLNNGIPCAVKITDGRSERACAEFHRERIILSEVQHKNIITMLGKVSSPQDVEKRVLVLEYMPNGTLFQKLRSTRILMSWNQRLKVVLQVAMGIEHLHSMCDPPIVHCDLKSSNVLLDKKFNAKVCDFGSARREGGIEQERRDKRGRRRSGSGSVMMMDSPGYTDPNFLRTWLPLRTKDVYSFGVILAEVLTGLEPVSEERNPKLLSTFVAGYFCDENKVLEVVDDRIRGSFLLEHVQAVARLSALCMSDDPSQRPSITEIVQKLRSLYCKMA